MARYTVVKRLCATGSLMDHALRNIRALIESGGQIMLGTVEPITNAAVAHDGQKTLVMLRKKKGELVTDLLERLDNAIATARASGQRVDEINEPSANVRTKSETAGRQHGLDVTLTPEAIRYPCDRDGHRS